jgi:signal transduction histidine kinase
MRARLQQLGGEFKIRSRDQGTAVTVMVPVDALDGARGPAAPLESRHMT